MKEIIAIATTSGICLAIVGLIRWMVESLIYAHSVHPVGRKPRVKHFGELAYTLLVVTPVFAVLAWGIWQLLLAGRLGIESLTIPQAVGAASMTGAVLFFTRVYEKPSDRWMGIALVFAAMLMTEICILTFGMVANTKGWPDGGIVVAGACWLGMLVFAIAESGTCDRPVAIR